MKMIQLKMETLNKARDENRERIARDTSSEEKTSSANKREALALEDKMDCSRMTIQRKVLKDSAKEAKEGRLQMVRAVKCIERMLPIQNLHQLNNPETKDDQDLNTF